MIKCCVIDDEPLAAAIIAKYVERTPFLQLSGTFGCAADALKTIKDEGVQLVFLDIEMPQLSGLELAKILPDGCNIIFITAYDRYAVQGFRVNAIDYLLKPVSYDEFLEAARRARNRIDPSSASPAQEYLNVKCGYENRRIPLSEIVIIEGIKNYIKIVLSDSSEVRTLITMKAVEQLLPDNFVRVHRSFIVNISRIISSRSSMLRIGDITVPVGETYRAALQERLEAE